MASISLVCLRLQLIYIHYGYAHHILALFCYNAPHLESIEKDRYPAVNALVQMISVLGLFVQIYKDGDRPPIVTGFR